jgi:hypothetical protein
MVKHIAFLLKELLGGRLYVLPFNFQEEGYMFYHLTFSLLLKVKWHNM